MDLGNGDDENEDLVKGEQADVRARGGRGAQGGGTSPRRTPGEQVVVKPAMIKAVTYPMPLYPELNTEWMSLRFGIIRELSRCRSFFSYGEQGNGNTMTSDSPSLVPLYDMLHDMRWYMANQSHYIGCLMPEQRKHRVYKSEKERIRMLREDELAEVPLVFANSL